jgi:tetratricopeptide (TPR) repeat protein
MRNGIKIFLKIISETLDKEIKLLFTKYKWRNIMKNIIFGSFGILISFLTLSCATMGNTQNNGNSSEYIAEYESMGIKVIDPVPMVAPSENEQAMQEYTIGTQFLNENKLEESEKHLKEAIRLDPFFVDAMDHLGRVYRIQNRLQEAEEIYLKSIEINDKNKVPYQNLAVVYKLQNRLNDAFELYKKMIQLDENDPESYYGIGELFYFVGDYENSMPFFDKAIELYIKTNSTLVYDAFFYKGMIYFRMDEYDQALKYLEEAKKGNPNNTMIEDTINEIKNKKI